MTSAAGPGEDLGALPPADRAALVDGLYAVSRRGGTLGQSLAQQSTLRAGLALQLEVLAHWERDGDRLGGWKVGLTSGRASDSMGEGFRPFGYVLRSRTFRSGEAVPLDALRPAGIEPELAFRIDAELAGPDVGVEEVARAIGAVAPAFELQQDRLPAQPGHPLYLADDLAQWGVVLGEPTTWERSVDTVAVSLAHDGIVVANVGPGFAIDDPITSIASMSRRLNSFGRRINSGEWIITGAFHKVPNVGAGIWTATFGDLGTVQVTLT